MLMIFNRLYVHTVSYEVIFLFVKTTIFYFDRPIIKIAQVDRSLLAITAFRDTSLAKSFGLQIKLSGRSLVYNNNNNNNNNLFNVNE